MNLKNHQTASHMQNIIFNTQYQHITYITNKISHIAQCGPRDILCTFRSVHMSRQKLSFCFFFFFLVFCYSCVLWYFDVCYSFIFFRLPIHFAFALLSISPERYIVNVRYIYYCVVSGIWILNSKFEHLYIVYKHKHIIFLCSICYIIFTMMMIVKLKGNVLLLLLLLLLFLLFFHFGSSI